jgi:hypothetical protein
LCNVANDIPLLSEARSQQKRIVDADYNAVDIDEHISSLPHLSDNEKAKHITLQAQSRQTRAYMYVMTVSGHTNYIVS